MKYKVLFVTSFRVVMMAGPAVAVHSTVVEFDSLQEADNAMLAVNIASSQRTEGSSVPDIRMFPLYKGG